MIKPLMIMVLLVALVIGGVFGWQAFIGSMMKKYHGAAATAPQTVSTVTAVATAWQAQIHAIGSCARCAARIFPPQASGVVDDIAFDSGNDVPAGKVLLKLKPNDDFAKLAAAAGRRRTRGPNSQARSRAIRGAGDQPGDHRYRCLDA